MRTEDQDDLRARYLASIEVLGEAAERMSRALSSSALARDLARRHVGGGGRVSDIENLLEPQPVRSSVSRAISDLERARHETQRLLFRLLLAEGRTMTDIARTWGISRQLVSRLVHEPEPESSMSE